MNKYKITLIGNPNVGKSTVFNALTGLNQHTGNWAGKTVDSASGTFNLSDSIFEIYDLPGTYSVISDSPEEKIARDFIAFNKTDLTVIVADGTCLARNLNLTLQICELCDNILLCVNLLDEAEKNNIITDFKKLEKELNIPVIGICAKKRKDIRNLKNTIYNLCTNNSHAKSPYKVTYTPNAEKYISDIADLMTDSNLSPRKRRIIALKLIDNNEFGKSLLERNVFSKAKIREISEKTAETINVMNKSDMPLVGFRDVITETIVNKSNRIYEKCTNLRQEHTSRGEKLDKVLTSKLFAFPIMALFLCLILWITIVGANYPSEMLSEMFCRIKPYLISISLKLHIPELIQNIIIDGVYSTTAFVVSVMLPPMAIFFPLFTLLEDTGFLPRIAFNLDKCFCKIHSTGKQALTMCMGLGCNAVGVTGCRIISSPAERLVAIITNSLMPCNGKFGLLTTLSAIFVGKYVNTKYSSFVSAVFVFILIILGITTTFAVTKLLNKTIIKNTHSDFIIEIPPFRKPQIKKTLVRSLLDRTLIILGRAVSVAAPAGAVIWSCSNICIYDTTILSCISNFLDPLAKLMGLDGVILLAFLLSFPANETVLPIILMGYVCGGEMVDTNNISYISEILVSNNWTFLTALNVMIFSVLHFPCATTIKTIKAETGSRKWTAAAFIIPSVCGILLCFFTTLIYNIIF